jgi:hypothetical protein
MFFELYQCKKFIDSLLNLFPPISSNLQPIADVPLNVHLWEKSVRLKNNAYSTFARGQARGIREFGGAPCVAANVTYHGKQRGLSQ